MAEHKKFPKLSDDWELKYRKIQRENFQEKALSTLVQNVSGGGVSFTAKEALPPESLLAIEMNHQDLKSPVIAIVNTVWCEKRRLDAMYDLGCEFWWIGWKNNEDQEKLSEYIKSNIQTCDGEACKLDDI